MCCSDPPPPPDLGPAAEASTEIARIQQQTAADQLEWGKEQDAMNREVLDQVLAVQLPAMRDQFENARSDRQRWETMFKPLEDQFVQEAKDYDSPERREQQRGMAIADVNTQFDAARRNSLSRLESYGVDPSQTRNAALDIGVRTQQAAAQAGAATRSDLGVEERGRALRGQAIQLGRGVVGGVGAQYAGAVGAGAAGVGGSATTTGAGIGALQSGLPFSSQALQGYGQGANILSQGYGNELTGWDMQQQQLAGNLQAIGTGVGMAAGIKDGGYIDGGRAIDPNVIEGQFEDVTDKVEGPGTGTSDEIPALLSNGEYVIPADVVRAKGEEFFDRLLEQYHDGPAPESLKIDREAA